MSATRNPGGLFVFDLADVGQEEGGGAALVESAATADGINQAREATFGQRQKRLESNDQKVNGDQRVKVKVVSQLAKNKTEKIVPALNPPLTHREKRERPDINYRHLAPPQAPDLPNAERQQAAESQQTD